MSTVGEAGVVGKKKLSSSASLLHWGGDVLLSCASSVLVATSVFSSTGVAAMSLAMASVKVGNLGMR